MSIVQELLRELGRELEQTVGEVEGVQQMLARMELEKMGLQVTRIGDNMDDERGFNRCSPGWNSKRWGFR